jgi:hypothetical protein
MSATLLEATLFPADVIAGLRQRLRVTARNSDGSVDGAFVGVVHFASTDPHALLPVDYAFVGGDAGVHDFHVSLDSVGSWRVTVSSGVLTPATVLAVASPTPPGWGLDAEALLPYGDAAAAIGASIVKAIAYSTREVDVTVSNLVQDNGAFLAGDALNPTTWTVQRLDTAELFHVVGVTQEGTYTYRLLCVETFGPVVVMHRVGSTTLKDMSGGVIVSPRSADFLGLLEDTQASIGAQLAAQRVTSRDLANAQTGGLAVAAGTLQITATGDYATVTGDELVKKLILRRLLSSPGDFFHLPTYGAGLREKERLLQTDLPKVQRGIELQVQQEPEVEAVSVSMTLTPATGELDLQVRAKSRKTGASIAVGLQFGEGGVVL